MQGILLIDKPKNITSHDVVAQIRKITGIQRIGHAGTLDPLATGLLIILVGRNYTKLQSKFLRTDKEYIATIRLGIETNTYDVTGEVINYYYGELPNLEIIKKALENFKGEIWQVPPAFSAKKIKGHRAYKLARTGRNVALKPAKINISRIQVVSYIKPRLKLKLIVSSGTYIRSLANDIGKKLGYLACLENLKRTRIGNYSLENSTKLNRINKENWRYFLKTV